MLMSFQEHAADLIKLKNKPKWLRVGIWGMFIHTGESWISGSLKLSMSQTELLTIAAPPPPASLSHSRKWQLHSSTPWAKNLVLTSHVQSVAKISQFYFLKWTKKKKVPSTYPHKASLWSKLPSPASPVILEASQMVSPLYLVYLQHINQSETC